MGLKDENIELKKERDKQKIKSKESEVNCQALNQNIIDTKKESQNEIKSLKRYADNYLNQTLGLNKELFDAKVEKWVIAKRDNHNVITYIILLFARHSFEQLSLNTKNTITNENSKFNKLIEGIFNSSKNFLVPTNFEAHNSSKINIIKKSFPKEIKNI